MGRAILHALSERLLAVVGLLALLTLQGTECARPVFTQKFYSKVIDEGAGTPIGTSVATVHATDDDPGDVLTYGLSPAAFDGFDINTATGLITTKKLFDAEIKTSYPFQATVHDSTDTSFKDTAQIFVYVDNVNEVGPTFIGIPYQSPNISELSPVDTHVITVAATDLDHGDQVQYSLFATPGSSKFKMGSNSGMITTAPGAVFNYSIQTSYRLTVIAKDTPGDGSPQFSSNTTLTVFIYDEDTLLPAFSQPTYTESISESLNVNDLVLTLTANDQDLVAKNPLRFGLDTASTPPAVQKYFDVGPVSGQVTLKAALDYEDVTQRTQQFRVFAEQISGRNKDIKVYSTVIVTVTDANDNEPKFEKNDYNETVNEQAPIGHVVLKLSATDADAYPYNQFNFSLVRGSGSSVAKSNDFLVVGDELQVARTLDFETTALYSLVVRVTEFGVSSPQSSDARVIVVVSDANDNDPEFSSQEYPGTQKENTAAGTSITKVSATDRDTGSFATIRYSIIAGNDRNAFVLDNVTGEISNAYMLDYERQKSYKLTVQAKDQAQLQARTDTAIVNIGIEDLNDNAPKWDQANYSVSITENAPAVSPLITVEAKDADDNANGQISYTFQPPTSAFAISSTGAITTLRSLDYEQQKQYSLGLMATDHGVPSKNGTAMLVVNVLDANDNSPQFVGPIPFQRQLSENLPPGTTLGPAIKATDLDSGLNGEVRYSISGIFADRFFIDPVLGTLNTTAWLDYEDPAVITHQYTLQVTASDQSPTSPRTNSTTLTISVTDENDNPPVFAVNKYSQTLLESAIVGTTIAQLSTNDGDTIATAIAVMFEFSGVNASYNGQFVIDSTTGLVQLAKTLDYEAGHRIFVLKAVAYNTNNVSLRTTTEASMTVIVQNVNDHCPHFAQHEYSMSVFEDVPVLTPVLTVVGIDLDVGASLTYSIPDATLTNQFATYFFMGGTTGQLSTFSLLDYENPLQRSFMTTALVSDGTPCSKNSSIVRITVKDVNDNAPKFTTPSVATQIVSIPEDTPRSTAVYTVAASDADSGTFGEVQYFIKAASPAGAFSMSNGTILVLTESDYEMTSQRVYSLEVGAHDLAAPPAKRMTGTTMIEIRITDINDNAPIFKPLTYSKGLPESSPIDTVILTVSATDADTSLNNNNKITFSIIAGADDVFKVNSVTGELQTKKLLDHEMVGSYTLTIQAQDGGTPRMNSTTTVVVTVDDVNDNPPKFDPTFYETSILENSPVPTNLNVMINATDRDSGTNGQLEFSFPDKNSGNIATAWKIDPVGGMMSQIQSLDRETLAKYSLTIQAKDRGASPRVATAHVNITIKDVNDNAPEFSPKTYTASVAENKAAGQTLTTVMATDADAPPLNNKIVFSLIGANAGDFDIDHTTGEITTRKPFNYEMQSAYTLTVHARDSGTPTMSNNATVVVTILDENDNAPVFVPKVFPARSFPEDITTGTEVFRFSATDADAPGTPNSQLVYSMTNSEGKFNLVPSATGQSINLAQTLDYESKKSYQLHITVSDQGSPPKSNTTVLDITVTDANDLPPVFTPSVYTPNVFENSSVPVPIVTVTAMDGDMGSNAVITYSFSGGDTSYFSINSTSGVISSRTDKKLDYELPSPRSFTLTVKATDSGATTMSATCTVQISVLDINDNQPNFLNAPYSPTIEEDAGVGRTVVQVDASDVDSTTLTYLLATPSSYFLLNPSSGVITTKTTLPTFETVKTHTVNVRVTDGKWNATTAVTITVLNQNTHRPKFYPQSVYSVDVKESAAPGTNFLEVFANDTDEGNNGKIKYNLATGRGDLFQLDETNGKLVLLKALDRETQDKYQLTVTANDESPKIKLTATAQIDIQVLDVDDQHPVFQFSSYSGAVLENQTAELSVATVKATDKDLGINAQIYYNITSGDAGFFQIKDPTNGKITTRGTGMLDREATPADPAYTLTVTATDLGSAHLQNTTTVTVTLLDINDNPPVFSQKSYPVSIGEDAPGAISILQVSSTDKDIGTNAFRTFTIVSVSPPSPGLFRMTADGVLETGSTSFDREKVPAYTLNIQVEDGTAATTPRYTDTATVQVTILDINDNPPKFLSSSYSDRLEESNASRNAVITTVSANDPDEGLNGTVAYAITAGNTLGNFTINPITGLITVMGTLDREAAGLTLNSDGTGVMTLTVTAYDRNNTKGTDPLVMTATTTVTVTITDANDNQPSFGASSPSAKLPESTAVTSTVTTVSASDRDVGLNAQIRYSISSVLRPSSSTTDDFAVNAVTGVITVASRLNAEMDSWYTLTIKATDRDGLGLSSTTSVDITVTDINEIAPAFVAQTYTGTVLENSPVATGTNVTVMAVDTDLLPANKNITYSITAGNTLSSFRIDDKTGKITTTKTIDRETNPFFSMTVVANDRGTPPLQGSCTVNIAILDENDNDPKLERSTYTVSIAENTGAGMSITLSPEIDAQDADIGINKKITYTLSGVGSEQFSLDSETAELFTANDSSSGLPSLDRERQAGYSLTVTATDGGNRTDTAKLTVNILDANDNYPMFDSLYYAIPDAYNEETPVGSNPLITVTASDGDDPLSPNSKIHYTISAGGRGHFTIGRTTGIITLAASLDRELESNYTLNITATDGGVTPLQNYTTVFMNVLDSNDNPPLFQPSNSYVAVIPEEEPSGRGVATISATDADISTNGEVTYAMVDDDGSGLSILGNTGIVTTTRKLDFETKQRYRVILAARDHGFPVNVRNATLDLTLTDINDNAPIFTSTSGYTAAFSETTVPPAQLLHFVANDADSGSNGQVRYYLDTNTTFFSLDPVTGILSLDQPVSADAGFQSFTLTINATDLGTPSMTSVTTATIKVNDINSHAPIFNQSTQYTGQVLENDLTIFPPLVQVAAYEIDRDGKTQPITFALALNIGNKFKIDSQTGVIRAIKALDREVQSLHSLTAVATDGVHNSTAIVAITVLDVNDNPPILPFTQLTRYIDENVANGTEAVSTTLISASDADIGVNALLTYEIIGTGNIAGAFSCDNATGRLTVSNNIDRETLAQYTFDVQVHDNGIPRMSDIATITIFVNDLNDNSPVFSPATYSESIKEDEDGGTTVVQVKASDIDLGSNSRLTYGLAGGDMGQFRIEADTGWLRTVGRLDFETTESYTINVSVHDNGAVPRYTFTTADVSVLDVNDWTPVFEFPQYSSAVLENVTIGTTLLTVNASDGDGSSPNNVFRFTLTNCTPAAGLQQFYLHEDTGEFYTSRTLDREQYDHYDFLITVTDRGTPRLSSTSLISVRVLDVDDNPPVFMPNHYGRLVSEGANIGDQIVTVVATDRDIGTNGIVRFSVVSGDVGGHFHMDPDSGLLTLMKSIDRETLNYYQLGIQAVDLGPGNFVVPATITINVTDINDNIPAFVPVCNGSGKALSVYENVNAGSSIVVLQASDRDISDNALLYYRITTVPTLLNPVPFQVNSLTGNVTTTSMLDREQIDEYKFTIQVRDNGVSPLSTFCNVLLKILDLNDNPPVFVRKSVLVNVPEDTHSGYVVTDNSATDADIGTNSVVQYSFLSGNDGKQFSINKDTGVVTLVGPLDRENTSSYLLNIVGQNTMATPVYNDTYRALVTVVDVNDNAPVFSKQLYTVTISEFTTIGTIVLALKVTDADQGQNAAVTLDIVSGNSDGQILSFFELRNGTNLVLAHSLDFETRTTFSLVVRATDSAADTATRLSTLVTVIVNIRDENDNPPVFTPMTYSFYLLENSTLNTELGNVMAMDSDTGVGEHITYAVSGGTGKGVFAIDPDNGTVLLDSKLDYETVKTYTLLVTASNILAGPHPGTGGVLTSQPATVTITVGDINDNAPVFSKSNYVAGISLDARPPHSVITVSASDADSGQYGTVRYVMPNPNPAPGAVFSINSLTGAVRSGSDYSEFTQQVLDLDVEAYDNLGEKPSLIGTASLTVFLLDKARGTVFHFNTSVETTEANLTAIAQWISNITGEYVHIDDAKIHRDSGGEIRPGQSDVTAYVINATSDTVFSIADVFRLVTVRLDPRIGDPSLIAFGATQLKFLGVLEPGHGSGGDSPPGDEAEASILQKSYFVALITIACILFIVLLLILIAICCLRKRRKIRQRHQQLLWESNFFATPPASMTSVEQYQNDDVSMGDQRELIDMAQAKKKKKKKTSSDFQMNPIWVQPNALWEDGGEARGNAHRGQHGMDDEEEEVTVRTTYESEGEQRGGGRYAFSNPVTTIEEYEETGPSAVSMDMRDNPLYESQEIKMDMFYTSESEDDDDNHPPYGRNEFNEPSVEDLDQMGSDAQLLEATIELEETEAEDPMTLI
ncbi:protocadherin Fat 4-like isoform X1 [Sycon ciliatum]|uniref:protocadherin Fat 4-like isoform X1 n=1 Tax=Sycon ciliatum TaxID=27933 RepID=UPI0031F6237A